MLSTELKAYFTMGWLYETACLDNAIELGLVWGKVIFVIALGLVARRPSCTKLYETMINKPIG